MRTVMKYLKNYLNLWQETLHLQALPSPLPDADFLIQLLIMLIKVDITSDAERIEVLKLNSIFVAVFQSVSSLLFITPQ